MLITHWSTVPSGGEFLPTLSEDFYNEINSGVVRELDIIIYTTTASNQDLLEIFFVLS
jgi:hypothetical protein